MVQHYVNTQATPHKMSNQTKISPEHIVIGCLFAPTDPNRFLEVTIRDGPKGTFILTRHNCFFKELLDMRQYHSLVTNDEDNEPHIMYVIYDRKLHGTPRCPYLVLKKVHKGQAVDLQCKDYIAATNTVDQYVIYLDFTHSINDQNLIRQYEKM